MLARTAVTLTIASSAAAFIVPPAVRTATVSHAGLNGWIATDSSEDCYGLPGTMDEKIGMFDPLSFNKGQTLNQMKRFRESEVMHSRVAMMAVVGYLVGESTPTPFGVSGPANDQLQQVPFPLFAGLTFAIGLAETFRATKGWVEPGKVASPDGGSGGPGTLRDNYYPGDLG